MSAENPLDDLISRKRKRIIELKLSIETSRDEYSDGNITKDKSERQVRRYKKEIEETEDELRQLQQEKAPETISVKQPVITPFLPVYTPLIGRKTQIDKITTTLTMTDSNPIASIEGTGGLGKTTLAREAVNRCSTQFENVVWVSAQTESLQGSSTSPRRPDIQDFDSLLDMLGSRLQIPKVVTLPLNEKKFEIQNHLYHKRTLIVLDNMESIHIDLVKLLIDELLQILGPGKAMVTTREPIQDYRITTISLKAMTEPDSMEFIQHYAEKMSNQTVLTDGEPLFKEIYKNTGGQPAAMQLVISQMNLLPKETVFDMLKNISPEDKEFYNYLYGNSWNVLTPDARHLLLKMSVVPAGVTNEYESLKTLTQLDTTAFNRALLQVLGLSLAEKSGSSYFIHPLLHTYINDRDSKSRTSTETSP